MDTTDWRCPQCGGRAFGRAGDEIRCNSDVNGQPLPARHDEQLRPMPGTSPVPCGWRGVAPATKHQPQFGSCKGMLTIVSDDDEHLEHFADYNPGGTGE